MYKYIRSSFKRELLFSFILVAILPLIISSFFMIRIFRTQIETIEQNNINTQISEVEVILRDYFSKIDQIGEEINQNHLILNSLLGTIDEDFINIHQKLITTTSDLRRYAHFEIYSLDGVCKFSTNTRVLGNTLPTYWGVVKEAKAYDGRFALGIERDYHNNPLYNNIKMARSIIDERGETVGFIVVKFKENALEILLEDKYNLKDFVAILDKNLNTVYDTGFKYERPFADVLKERIINGEDVNQLVKEYNIYISSLEGTDLYLLLQRDLFFTSDINKTIYNVVLLMIILSLVLSVIVSLKLSRALFKPIYITNDAMHEIEKGNLNTRIKIDRIDEFGGLALNFNSMVEKLEDYMESKVRQQKELNESNIKMMQAQLNPHFIYNTLDTIKWVAKSRDVPEIVVLVTRLAKILRSSISTNQLISVKEELDMVKNYMEIQQLRFNNKFTFTIDVSEEEYKYIIPKLSIQPLVENAVIHGLIDQDEGYIHISIDIKNDTIFINIADDGCGIDDENLKNINNKVERDGINGIGIFNIDKIIKLRYGEEFGVFLSKGSNGGTISTVFLPAILKKEEYHD